MSKDRITDYSATAADNTDIGGVNIQGTAAISNADNAFREQMSHLAEMNAGTHPLDDTVTFCDPVDKTKRVRLDAGNVTAGQTRVLSMPDANVSIPSGTLVTEAGVQTLSNKTFPAPNFSTSIALTGDVTPPQITANQNDYAPTGHAAASVFRLSSDASRAITGLAGGSDGRLVAIYNVGAQDIILSHDHGASVEANRFYLVGGQSFTLWGGSNTGITLQYDATQSRWLVVGGMSAHSASSTDMEAAVNGWMFVSPSVMHRHPGVAKCWGEFAINGTVLKSYNITGVADTGVGIATVTIANDFSDANWSCIVSRSEDDMTLVYSATYDAKTAGTVILRSVVEAGSASDPSAASGNASWSFAGFGDH